MSDLSQERIWIIGASSGIGAAVAKAYAKRGASLILSARSQGPLQALADEIGATALACDVGERATIEEATAQIAQSGPLDRIIHLAALYDPGAIAELDHEKAAQLVQVNLMGTFHIAQLAPSLLREGGQLALCGSVAGYIGLPKGQIYSATKAAVINLTESLRAERKDRDIRLISPGFVSTPMTAKNDFDMPAVITPDAAATAIVRGLDGSGFEVHFPRRLTLALKLLRLLPYRISLALTKRIV
ncbi:SDR family NAD(P)-dependent oxidoreductase [Albirhodobacter sp. R86504]|uniref:SDR family NAD(P)-dependent oxidoreductase n=1 Tax=Albirhodobacter sp. R86504 TaxID=3093848 RepID=UPI0036711A06